MGEIIGVLAAVLSSSTGGLSVGVTRFVVGATDPITIGAFRFGIGSVLLLPLALRHQQRWPKFTELEPIIGLGLLYFALFPILFNASLIYTTAARGSLALSTLPVLTMLVGAMLRVEPLTPRKTTGVALATLGVAVALLTNLAAAPDEAWRGDLLMVAAAFTMALYSIWSKPLAQRYGTIVYTALAMTFGGIALVGAAWASGGIASTSVFGSQQWAAIVFLGVFGGAATFLLWSYALERTTPTRVAISVTVNPIFSALFGAYVLNEPITTNLIAGLVLVTIGIAVATSNR
ncbi:MAG: DMT family transporter [Hyphomicrobiaceae bacterium]